MKRRRQDWIISMVFVFVLTLVTGKMHLKIAKSLKRLPLERI